MRPIAAILMVCAASGCAKSAVELRASDAVASIAMEHPVVDVVASDVDGDGRDDLLVLTSVGDVDTGWLFLGADLSQGALLTEADAHIEFRGEIEGIAAMGEVAWQGGDAIAMGGPYGWSLYRPDELVEPGVRVIVSAPARLLGGGHKILAVAGGEMGDLPEAPEMGIVVALEDDDANDELVLHMPARRLPEVAEFIVEQSSSAVTTLARTPLPRAQYSTDLHIVADMDSDQIPEVVSGGYRDFAAVTLSEGWTAEAQVKACDEWIASCDFETFVRPAGDVNGDGRADLLVSDAGQYKQFTLFSGSSLANGWSGRMRVLSDYRDVVSVGDVDRDGRADLVARPILTPDEPVLLWGRGGGGKLPVARAITEVGEAPLQLFAGGDVDGDGLGDVVVTGDDGHWLTVAAPGLGL